MESVDASSSYVEAGRDIIKKEKIYLDEEADALYRIKIPRVPIKTKIKNYCSCSRDSIKKFIYLSVPILYWVPHYKIRNLPRDIAAGCTIGVVNIPQGMAYALLAAVPAVYGLYASFFPPLVFAVFSTSRHVSIGTDSVIAMMIGAQIQQNVDPCPKESTPATTLSPSTLGYTDTNSNFTASSSTSCQEQYNDRTVQLAIAIAFCVGVIQLIMRVFHLGFIRSYLSSYLIAAFICGAAYQTLVSQLPKLFGLSIPTHKNPFALVYTLVELCKELGETNPWDFLVSVCSIVFLVIGKEINVRFHDKFPFPPPWELAVIIFSTLASYYGLLHDNHGVVIVGDIPTGVQIMLPQISDVVNVISGSIAISIVMFAVEISLAQMFSIPYNYDVDANQELAALGAANLISSFFGCFPCAASLSRTAIWDEVGGQSQVVGIISSVIILTVLLWLGPLFEDLPQAALAAIIIVNLKRLMLQLRQIAPLWRKNKLDCVTWVFTFVSVCLFGVALGLLIAVMFEFLLILVKTQSASADRLGKIWQADSYFLSKYYRVDNNEDKSILLLKPKGPIYFANKESVQNIFNREIGFDPTREIFNLNKPVDTDNDQDSNDKVSFTSEKCSVKSGFTDKNINIYTIENDNIAYDHDNNFIGSNLDIRCEDFDSCSTNTCSTISEEMDKPETKRDQLKFVVLDLSAVSFVDTDGAKLIKAYYTCLKQLKIKMVMCCSTYKVRKEIKKHCKTHKVLFFITLDGAIEFATGNLKLDLDESEQEEVHPEDDVKSLYSIVENMDDYSISSDSSSELDSVSTEVTKF